MICECVWVCAGLSICVPAARITPVPSRLFRLLSELVVHSTCKWQRRNKRHPVTRHQSSTTKHFQMPFSAPKIHTQIHTHTLELCVWPEPWAVKLQNFPLSLCWAKNKRGYMPTWIHNRMRHRLPSAWILCSHFFPNFLYKYIYRLFLVGLFLSGIANLANYIRKCNFFCSLF